GKELFRLPATKSRCTAVFGPGGRHIVRFGGAEDNPFEIWNVEKYQPRLIRKDSMAVWTPSVHFRPDASIVAVADLRGTIALLDLEKATEINRLRPTGGERESMLALHPTEPLVASCSYFTMHVVLRDFRTGQTVQVIHPPWPMGSSSVAWHP